MGPDDLARHATTVRATLESLGPRARARIVVMLQGLGLSAADAEAVLAHGIGAGMFAVDAADPSLLRARPREP